MQGTENSASMAATPTAARETSIAGAVHQQHQTLIAFGSRCRQDGRNALPVPSLMCVMVAADEAEYTLTYGERGSRVVIVASEPITRSAGHWVRCDADS